MLTPMFEDFSRNRRFSGWLETVANGQRSDYPEPESFADDARAFFQRFDRIRGEQRTLDAHYRELLVGLGELAEIPTDAHPRLILESLGQTLQAAREEGEQRADELEAELASTSEQLEATRTELDQARAELADARAELQREKRKLEPVLRYAYNLRRLVQKIHATGQVTPSIRRYIEQLLEAGGVNITPNAQPAAAPQTRNATSTVT